MFRGSFTQIHCGVLGVDGWVAEFTCHKYRLNICEPDYKQRAILKIIVVVWLQSRLIPTCNPVQLC